VDVVSTRFFEAKRTCLQEVLILVLERDREIERERKRMLGPGRLT
jgi:hypothetical protein